MERRRTSKVESSPSIQTHLGCFDVINLKTVHLRGRGSRGGRRGPKEKIKEERVRRVSECLWERETPQKERQFSSKRG
jgi:hypothetical protein